MGYDTHMPLTPTYNRFSNSLQSIRGVGISTNSSGIIVGALLDQSAFVLTSGGVVATLVSGQPRMGFAGQGMQVVPAGTQTWLMDYAGMLTNFGPGSGNVTTISGTVGLSVFTGACVTSGGVPYAITSAGVLWTSGSNGLVSGLSFNQNSYGLSTAGNFLYTICPSGSGVGTYNTGSNVTGFINFTSPAVINNQIVAANGTGTGSIVVAVGGWNGGALSSGFTAVAADPTNPFLLIGSTPAASAVTLWTNNGSGSFNFTQVLTGVGRTNALAWADTGSTVLGTDATNNSVYVMSYTFGTLALAQTLTVSGASGVAITTDSTHALVLQPGLNQITALQTSGLSWIASGTVAIGSPLSIIPLSSTQMLVGCSSGLATLSLSVSGWSVSSTSGVGFTPTAIFNNGASGYVAVGTSGSSGVVWANQVSGSFSGAFSGLVVQQSQIATVDMVAGMVRVFSAYNSKITLQFSANLPANQTGALAMVGNYVFAGATGITYQFYWGSPYILRLARVGEVGAYNGSSWVVGTLGVGNLPTALAFDASGNVIVASAGNNLYTMNSSGVFTNQNSIPVFTGQNIGVPIGIAAMQFSGTTLYAATSLNDSIIRVSG